MWRKAESGPIWLQTASNDALIYSPPEREDLIQEAIDCVDYAEEKLLELEYSPDNISGVRRLQSTFVRLYELAWVLRSHEIFAIVQRARAFLTYVRQGSVTLHREDVGRMFELCSALQELFGLLREQHNEPLRVVSDHSSRSRALPEHLEEQRSMAFSWIHNRLLVVEREQLSHVTGRSPKAAPLFPSPPLTPVEAVEPEGEDAFGEARSDSQELRSLKQLVGELDKSVSQLQEQLNVDKPSSAVTNALHDLLSLHKALHQRVDSLATEPRPTSSLFGLVIGNGDQYYCLPTSALLALIPAAEVQLHQWDNEQTLVAWGASDAVPLRALGDLLPALGASASAAFEMHHHRKHTNAIPGVASGPVPSSQAFCLILHTQEGPCALWVEVMLREMMVELLYAEPQEHPALQGGCQLPDGQAAFLLDVPTLFAEQAPAAEVSLSS